MKPIRVFVAYHEGAVFTQDVTDGYYVGFECQILDKFEMSDGSCKQLKDMSDDEILSALALASATGKTLEKKGFRVAY